MKRVLVTGSSRGIGKAIALQLAQAGFNVTVHCRSQTAHAQAVVEQILTQGGQADWVQFDITDRPLVRLILEKQVAEHGAYWGVVCNAGITRDGPFAGMNESAWDEVITTGLDGFYNVVQPLVMPMIRLGRKVDSLQKGGRIVTIASVSGMIGNRGQVNYSAAKAGLIGATKALAMELASRGITVNCVAPGLIASDMTEALPDDVMAQTIQAIPMGVAGSIEDVAATVNFLFSPGAAYITRQVIGVNGGLI
jgi:3-oxoacyl-[acyl-carrier protein] reductase